MNKVLVICGPTATGKTDLAIKLARKYSGELVSADSRQLYKGLDIITGKDIPANFEKKSSNLFYDTRPLTYWTDDQIKIWLTDLIEVDKTFNVSFYNDCANLVIADIHNRNKLPIVVGATGLYIKSLTSNLSDIHIPINSDLREKYKNSSPDEMFAYLRNISPEKANKLNDSDKKNPRRLIRAIEISLNTTPSVNIPKRDFLQIGLIASREYIFPKISQRVKKRIDTGAFLEVKNLLSQGYSWSDPGMHISGVRVWQDYQEEKISQKELVKKWETAEFQDFRQLERWFKKAPEINWFNVSNEEYVKSVMELVDNWYNN